MGIRDVDLDDDQVRLVVQIQLLDVLVLQRGLEIGIQMRSESRETQWRKQRVLDGAQ
jgi:hypothetical protein